MGAEAGGRCSFSRHKVLPFFLPYNPVGFLEGIEIASIPSMFVCDFELTDVVSLTQVGQEY